jgi:hypothetical protein
MTCFVAVPPYREVCLVRIGRIRLGVVLVFRHARPVLRTHVARFGRWASFKSPSLSPRAPGSLTHTNHGVPLTGAV